MISAVSYYRMSSDKQETSIGDQRAAVERLAKDKGYKIIREYRDEGISGDDTLKRKAFQRLIRDAQDKGDFEVMLCWDQDRFGRFDSIESGFWIKPLRDAGVRLETIAQGAIDWNDFAGRMIFGIQQEAKHQFLRDLSRNVARGKHQRAVNGEAPISRPPYGYDKEFVDAGGSRVVFIPRIETIYGGSQLKQRGWKARLVVNAAEAKIVRRIFESYVNQDIGMRGIALALNSDGVSTPAGKVLWKFPNIRSIITNPAYCGDFIWGQFNGGKFHYTTKDGIKPQGAKRIPRAWKRRPVDDCVVHKDHHEAIVSRELWAMAQEKMTLRRHRSTKRTLIDKYLLSGLLICGHCSARMHGQTHPRSKRAQYRCSTYAQLGKDHCQHYAIDQKPLLEFVFECVRRELFANDRLGKLRAMIAKKLRQRRRDEPQLSKHRRKSIEELTRKIDQAAERLLTAPENITDLLAPKIAEWRDERDRMQRLEKQSVATPATDIEAETERIMAKTEQISEEFKTAPPARLRELLRRFVPEIRLFWEEDENSTYKKHLISRVQLTIPKDVELQRPDQIDLSIVVIQIPVLAWDWRRQRLGDCSGNCLRGLRWVWAILFFMVVGNWIFDAIIPI